MVRDVKTPSVQEMEEHNCTHIPSQPWCPACVAGKKPNSPHKRQAEGEHLVPEIGLDYAFLRESDNIETLTILVMKDRDIKTIFAGVVEMKGRGLEGTVENVVKNIARLGYKKVILCSDQEPAIIHLIEGVIAERKEPTIPQHSPVGESQSNGLVEKGRQVYQRPSAHTTTRSPEESRVPHTRRPPHHDLDGQACGRVNQ